MSMSTHVVGFRPPDEKWQKMKRAYYACQVAGVLIPSSITDFFDGVEPDPLGVEVGILGHPCVSEYQKDGREGYEVDITILPPDVKIIRFYNSW